MNTSIQDTCCITSLSISDLSLIHSSLSHGVIDICRSMRHQNMTCEAHNALSAQMTELQKVIHKVGVVIESRKAIATAYNQEIKELQADIMRINAE